MEKFQALYDDYLKQYNIKPQEINLIAYGRKKGTKINFTEAKKLVLLNNRKQNNTLPKQRNAQKQKKKQSKHQNADISSLQTAASSLKPIDITRPKSKPQQISVDTSSVSPNDEIMYKTNKRGSYVKKKGTGTTPKARKQFFDMKSNPFLLNDKKTKKKKKRKKIKSPPPRSPPPPSPDSPSVRRKRTPISPIVLKPAFVQSAIAKSKPNKPLPPESPKKKLSNTDSPKLKTPKSPKKDTKSIQKSDEKKKKKVKKIKWDKTKEKEVVNWINDIMKQQIIKANGKKYIESMLENGQLITRIINKIGGNIDAKIIKQKPNDLKCDTQRIEEFIKSAKALGMNEKFVFNVDDLREHKNINGVLDALCCLKNIQKNKKNNAKKKDITPLELWCKRNKISENVHKELKKNKYDLGQLLNFQADDIQNVLMKQLNITQSAEKLELMKQLVKLKEMRQCEEWIIFENDICANTKTKKIFHTNDKSDVELLVKPFLNLYSIDSTFFGDILMRYMNEDWFAQNLFSVVSRLSTTNKNEMAKKLAFKFASKRYKPIVCKALYSTDVNEMFDTKCSYNLMKILQNDGHNEVIDALVNKHYAEIVFHSLSVFHPLSSGNAFHGRNILMTLLDKYPFYLFEVITENKYIQLLLKYAIFTQLHHGNFSEFMLEMISFSPRLIEEGGPFKDLEQCKTTMDLQALIIQKLIKWEWIEYLLTVCSGNRLYDANSSDDVIIVNYLQFLTDLVPQCTYNICGAQLFEFENKDNAKCILIESLLNGLLNDKLTKSHRVLCTKTIVSILDIIKLPSLIEDDENMQNNAEEMMTMQNFLHFLFVPAMQTMYAFVDKLCTVIIDENMSLQPVKINHEIIKKPFGQIRLSCLEMLTVTLDLFIMDAAKPLSVLSMAFFETIFDLAFVHKQNNFFLTHFRKLLHLSVLFRRRIFEHLCQKCNFLNRCVTFYTNNANTKSEFHGYILDMLWMFYTNDQNFSEEEDDQFDIFGYFQSHQEWLDFHRHFVDFEMKSRIIHEFEPEHVSFDESSMYEPYHQNNTHNDSDYDDDSGYDDDDSKNDPDDMEEESNELNWNPFRDSIYSNLMPHVEYLSHFGLFQDYTHLNIASNANYAPNNTELMYLQYVFAQTQQNEKYLLFNLKQRQMQRTKKLNLMMVMEHSAKMKNPFLNESKSKMDVLKAMIYSIFVNVLDDDDRFGLISFNHEAYEELECKTKSDYNLEQVKECIMSINEGGGCDIDEAYDRAISSFAEFDDDEYENRILFVTAACEIQSVLDAVHHCCERDIFTTFCSMGQQFIIPIIREVEECKGCNYVHIESEDQFASISFDCVFNPICFNVNVSILDNETNQSAVDEIYGGMMNEDERTYRIKTGTVQSFKTLFAESMMDSDIKLIKLKESVGDKINILVQIEDANDESSEIEINDVCLPEIKSLPYFDNEGIAYYLLLTQYVNLLREWIMNDYRDEYLFVSEEYKQKFVEFQTKMKECDENNLFEQEMNVMDKLIHFDWESAKTMRDLAKYDNVDQNDDDYKEPM